MTMTNNKITNGGDNYIAPLCTLADFHNEGVLCSSFETPEEYTDAYKW